MYTEEGIKTKKKIYFLFDLKWYIRKEEIQQKLTFVIFWLRLICSLLSRLFQIFYGDITYVMRDMYKNVFTFTNKNFVSQP